MKVEKFVWQFPVDLPGGKFCVVVAEVPHGITDIYGPDNAPKREFWKSKKLFKRKANADKYMNKVYSDQRNHNLTQNLIDKGLMCLN